MIMHKVRNKWVGRKDCALLLITQVGFKLEIHGAGKYTDDSWTHTGSMLLCTIDCLQSPGHTPLNIKAL